MKKLTLIIGLCLSSLSASAQDAFYVSGMLGLTGVESTPIFEFDNELSYGVRAGVLFNDHVSVGLYINRYGTTSTIQPFPTLSADVSLTNIMGEVTYYFNPADENGFWLSGLLGTTQSNLSCPSNVSCVNESDTSFGLTAGYQFAVAPNFTLGPQFSYVVIDGDSQNTGTYSGMFNLTFWM